MTRDLEAREVHGPTRAQVERSGERRVGGNGTIAEDRDDGFDIRTGGHREGADKTPAAIDATDQGCGDRGGARIKGEEGSGLARHLSMLPARPDRWFEGTRVKRPRRPRRPTPPAG